MTHERSHSSSTADALAHELDDELAPGRTTRSSALRAPEAPLTSGLVQRKAGDDEMAPEEIHGLAERGVAGSGASLPFLDVLQDAFGSVHDLSGVRAHTGDAAREANAGMGSEAFAMGEDVVFGKEPDLHTAAHEAAHVVQQRRGVQLSGGVGSAGDPYERHADEVADRVVRGQPVHDLLGGGPAGPGATGIQRKTSADLSVGDGLKVSFSGKIDRTYKFVKVSSWKVEVSGKPTASKEPEVHEEGTEGTGLAKDSDETDSAGEEVLDRVDEGTKVEANTKGDASASLEAGFESAAKSKWGSTVFTEGTVSAGSGGGDVSLTFGAEWKNFAATVKFSLISLGEDDETKQWDIKVLSATPSVTVRDVLEVDGVNFSVKATGSLSLELDKMAVGKKLLEMGIIKSLKGVGELLGEIGGIPFLFVEAGYETLKAAGKNIMAGKDMAAFIDQANIYSLEVGQNFVDGVLGGGSGQGAASGQQWFTTAFQATKAEHPDITQAEFRDALAGAPGWQESAKVAVARQIRSVMFEAFVAEKKDDIHAKDMAHVKTSLFGDEVPPPDPKGGLGVPLPEIVDKADRPEVSEEEGKDFAKRMPHAVYGIAKQRVSNGEHQGSFWTDGVDYAFTYTPSDELLEISGGGLFEMMKYKP